MNRRPPNRCCNSRGNRDAPRFQQNIDALHILRPVHFLLPDLRAIEKIDVAALEQRISCDVT